MKNSLLSFIEHARKKGMDHQTIRMLLLSSGWKEKDIARALTQESLDMDIPVPPDTGGAREAFMHLVTFASFYTATISLSILFFSYINRLFPDPAFDYYLYSDDLSGIRWSLAALIVSFPLYIWLQRTLIIEMREHTDKAWSAIRRWLTYLTLFVAASALVVDLITFVFTLLEGELSIRFLLKVAVVLLLAGCTFGYFLASLKLTSGNQKKVDLHRGFGIVATIVSGIALLWGFALVGTPGSSRDERLDDVRENDLQTIQTEIEAITLGERRFPTETPSMIRPLPESLDDVAKNAIYTRPNISDPVTGTQYEYTVNGKSAYTLCAVFDAVNDDNYNVQWNHPAGRHCFEFDVLK